MPETIFDKIVSGEIPSYKVWEDENFLAFLTPFPNTPGFTVVIPKKNPGDYVFEIDDKIYHDLLDATKKVATVLKKAMNVSRVGLVFEGEGVPHVHAKLIPLNGDVGSVTPKEKAFNEEYPGYLTTLEGPEMDTERLKEIQAKIVAAQE